MTEVPSIEEPCVAKVTSTVLKASGGSDPFAEPNRAIKAFVMGRKAFLFSDTPAGARALANLYALVETAKANGQEPWAYLKRVFTELPVAEEVAQIEALLPWQPSRGSKAAA